MFVKKVARSRSGHQILESFEQIISDHLTEAHERAETVEARLRSLESEKAAIQKVRKLISATSQG